MASIRDVAIKAGVGIGTVSRALNGSGYISDETKQKIMQAVEELNYKPNELAQNLFRNKSGFIGIVVKNLSHPFMASLVKHVENNLYTNGYKCMLCEVGGQSEPHRGICGNAAAKCHGRHYLLCGYPVFCQPGGNSPSDCHD